MALAPWQGFCSVPMEEFIKKLNIVLETKMFSESGIYNNCMQAAIAQMEIAPNKYFKNPPNLNLKKINIKRTPNFCLKCKPH